MPLPRSVSLPRWLPRNDSRVSEPSWGPRWGPKSGQTAVLNEFCRVPQHPVSAHMHIPKPGVYKIKGVGDVLVGRVEQGLVKPGEEVVFLPTHIASNPHRESCSPRDAFGFVWRRT